MTKGEGDNPALLALDAMREARAQLEYAELRAMETARYLGLTWADIGDGLHLTPQAAQQRYARLAARML